MVYRSGSSVSAFDVITMVADLARKSLAIGKYYVVTMPDIRNAFSLSNQDWIKDTLTKQGVPRY